MTDKHPDAGVRAAIEVVEGHRNLFEGDSKREALCTSILSCLRALPAQQPNASALVEALANELHRYNVREDGSFCRGDHEWERPTDLLPYVVFRLRALRFQLQKAEA